jgi:serine/threonine protein kinase
MTNLDSTKGLVAEFEALSSSLKINGQDLGEQAEKLLEVYKDWLELEVFKDEFCCLLVDLVEKIFEKGNQKRQSLGVIKLLKEQELLLSLFEVLNKADDKPLAIKNYLLKKNKKPVSNTLIEQILNKRSDSEHIHSFAKFKLRKNDLLEKNSLGESYAVNFIITINALASRVVKCELYKFEVKAFMDDGTSHAAYSRLILLPNLLRHWIEIQGTSDKSNESNLSYFLMYCEKEFENSSGKGVIRLGLESLISKLKDGYEKAVSITQANSALMRNHKSERTPGGYDSLILKYTLQLWMENKKRACAEALPQLSEKCLSKTDVEKSQGFCSSLHEKNANLSNFLVNDNFDGRVNSLRDFFSNKSDNSPLLNAIFSDVFFELNKSDFKVMFERLFSDYLKKRDAGTEYDLERIAGLAKHEFSFDFRDYFKYSSLVHFLILQSESKSYSLKELIEESFTLEETIIYRSLFLNYILGGMFKEEGAKIAITEKFKDYKSVIFRIARAWVLFLNENIEFNGELDEFINNNLTEFFKSTHPTSIKGLATNEATEDVKKLCVQFGIDLQKLNGFPFRVALEADEIDLDSFNTSRNGIRNKFGIEDLVKSLTHEKIDLFWKGIVGKHDEDIAFHAYIYNFFDDVKIRRKAYGRFNGHTREKIKNVLEAKDLNSFVVSFKNKGFDKLHFDFDDSLAVSLNEKLTAVSNISSLESARFRLVRDDNNLPIRLGKGGFGCVYKANDVVLDSEVAIKLIPKWSDSIALEKKMLNEAVIMRKCRHENVVTLFDVFSFSTEYLVINECVDEKSKSSLRKDKYIHGLVMECIEGARTLKDFVGSEEFKKFSYKQKLDLFLCICKGVEQAHNQTPQVVHGDIKPENILIDQNGIPKLTDFGVSSTVGSNLIGSSGKIYSSSNVLEGGQATIQDDIHSLGMVLISIFFPVVISLIVNDKDGHLIKEKLFALLYFYNRECNKPTPVDENDEMLDENIEMKKIFPSSLFIYSESFLQLVMVRQLFNIGSHWLGDFILKSICPNNSKQLSIISKYFPEDLPTSDDKLELMHKSNIDSELFPSMKVDNQHLLLEEYRSINQLVLDINSCRGSSEFSIKKTGLLYGELLTSKILQLLPEKDVFNEWEKYNYSVDSLTVLCLTEKSYLGEKESYIAKFNDGETFRFSISYPVYSYHSNFIVENFYKRNKKLIEQLQNVKLFGLSPVSINPILQCLFDNSKTIFNSMDYKFKLETVVFDAKTKCFYYFSSTLNSLKKNVLSVVREILNTEITKAYFEYFKEDIKYYAEKIEMILSNSESIHYGEGLDNWKLFSKILELNLMSKFNLSHEFVAKFEDEITSFCNSDEIKLLESDLNVIEKYMKEDIYYRLNLMCDFAAIIEID